MRKFKIVTCVLVIIAVLLSLICIVINLPKENTPLADEKNVAPQAQAETPAPTEAVKELSSAREKIKAEMDKVYGNCQWGYHIFSTGEEYITDSRPMPSASIIKVFIMEYAFDQIEKGNLKLADTVYGTSLEYHINAMITRSDNDSTNALIEKFGMEELNRFFREKGYADTKVQRKMLDTKAQQEGRDNFTSVPDVMTFLKKVYQNKDIPPYKSMLSIMKKQERRGKIPRNFSGDVTIANKTGELSNVENDIAIIFGEESDYAIAFLCSNLSDTASARNAISNGAYQFYLTAEGIE